MMNVPRASCKSINKPHTGQLTVDNCKINNLTVKKSLNFDLPELENTDRKIALLLLLNNRYSDNIWSRLPYDIVKIIAKEVAKPNLIYLPIIVNGKKYRIRLEPIE